MLNGVFFIVVLATTLAVVLVIVHKRLSRNESTLIDEIEARLPRIQCAQCGYPGCRPYAAALASGAAAINLCPPGGEQTIRSLAALLGQDPAPLDISRGSASLERVARIDEPDCIGCNLCLQACPVDAIVGVPQTMHTVLANLCTGCELCIPPCPVDCIKMLERHA